MLTERQLLILQLLVDDYIRTAEPVGSRTIAKRSDVPYSSATIRNELSDLEEMGFLEKPHSSSGRIPSEKGYRFYVDHLLSPASLSREEMKQIQTLFRQKIVELEDIAQQTAGILSDFTNYTSVVLGPEVFETRLKHIEIVTVTRDTAVAIIVTNTGHVENRMVSLPAHVRRSDLQTFVNILNDRLSGTLLIDLNYRMHQEIASILKANIDNYQDIMQMVQQTFSYDAPEKVFYGGKTNILSQPEFHDIDTVRSLLNTIEEEDTIYQLLHASPQGIQIKIGHENDLASVANCSIITADYSIMDQQMGKIAIIGPTRMKYRRVVSLLDHVSRDLSRILTERYRDSYDW